MSLPVSYISRSKTVNETISLFADFRDFLQPGEVIGVPLIDVEVFTGFDLIPMDMLYLGYEIHKGAIIEQRFRLGLPGVIYSITFILPTNLHVYEIGTRLAVLPNLGDAIPIFSPTYYTSRPYPIDVLEAVGDTTSISKSLFLTPPLDATGDVTSFISGSLRAIVIIYDKWPPEAVGDLSSILSGELKTVVLLYSMLPEAVSDACIINSGELKQIVLQYFNYRPEGVLDTTLLVSGTLI